MRTLKATIFAALSALLIGGATLYAQSNPGVFSCAANQWMNAVGIGGVQTCAQPAFSNISGTAQVGQGGTGITSGTSGGVLAFTGTTTIASSGLLAANGVMLGGGAGVAPSTVTPFGTAALVSNGAGVPAWTGAALTGQVLSGNTGNAPTFQTASWSFIEVLTASSSASLTTSTFTAAYDDYVFVIDNIVPATDGAVFNATVESGGSFQATTYKNNDGTTTTNIALSLLLSNTAGQGVGGEAWLKNVNSTSVNKMMTGRDMYWVTQTSLTFATSNMAGFWNGGQGAVTRVRFQMSSGNISTGSIKVYGLRNS